MASTILNYHWENDTLFVEAKDIEEYMRRSIITIAKGRDKEQFAVDSDEVFVKECTDQIAAIQDIADRFVGWRTFAHNHKRTGKAIDINAPISDKIKLTDR